MIKGFTAGTFSLLHAGHVIMLKEVKAQYYSSSNLIDRICEQK